MLDAKRALDESDGRHGQGHRCGSASRASRATAKRADREASEGAVAIGRSGNAAAIVQLRSETDFVAKSDQFVEMVASLADLVAAEGESAIDQRAEDLERMKTTSKENISVGTVVRIEAPPDGVVDSYLHRAGRPGGQRGGGGARRRRRRAGPRHRHPHRLRPSEPTSPVTRCPRPRWPRSARRSRRIARNEGKPEAALPKIVEGRLNGWYKERVLLDQAYIKDEKQTIATLLGPAKVDPDSPRSWSATEAGGEAWAGSSASS